MTEQELTLQQCLQQLGLTELPAPINGSTDYIWVRGIVCVQKTNGTKAYCIAHNNGKEMLIKRDFGAPAKVDRVLEIYPLEQILKTRLLSDVNDKAGTLRTLCDWGYSREAVIELMTEEGKTAENIAADKAKLQQMIVEVSAEYERNRTAEEERAVERALLLDTIVEETDAKEAKQRITHARKKSKKS
jgi:hypothetical protein